MILLAAALVVCALLVLFLLPVAVLFGILYLVGLAISLFVDGSRTLVRTGVLQ